MICGVVMSVSHGTILCDNSIQHLLASVVFENTVFAPFPDIFSFLVLFTIADSPLLSGGLVQDDHCACLRVKSCHLRGVQNGVENFGSPLTAR